MLGMMLAATVLAALPARAAAPNFVPAWTASAQGPYPLGNPTAQPELGFAFPSAETGARDQSFRLILRPDIWGKQARLRFSNAYGTRPVTFTGVHVGLQLSGAAIVPGTNRGVTFATKQTVTIPPGRSVLSDPVPLAFLRSGGDRMLAGRKLAISFHAQGETGPMTWHAKALQTSYLTPPGSGPRGEEEAEGAYPYSTTSWYFLDMVEMVAPKSTRAIVAFGDSITDGTFSTINGDDRWPDVLSRRLHAAYGEKFAVVNQGIGGNRIATPADYRTAPIAGGPSALERLERDVISLPNVGAVIWLEGINDFGSGASLDSVTAGLREGVKRLRARIPGVRLYMGTLTSALGSTPTHGTAEVEAKRIAFNHFVRTSGLFDGVIDFSAATIDSKTGALRPEFQPNSSTGGPGDRLHPNRAGYAAMGAAIDLKMIAGQ